jgi:hypothetical protein
VLQLCFYFIYVWFGNRVLVTVPKVKYEITKTGKKKANQLLPAVTFRSEYERYQTDYKVLISTSAKGGPKVSVERVLQITDYFDVNGIMLVHEYETDIIAIFEELQAKYNRVANGSSSIELEDSKKSKWLRRQAQGREAVEEVAEGEDDNNDKSEDEETNERNGGNPNRKDARLEENITSIELVPLL